MKITIKLTKEEKETIIENYLRSLYSFGFGWRTGEIYLSLGEFEFIEKKDKYESRT